MQVILTVAGKMWAN